MEKEIIRFTVPTDFTPDTTRIDQYLSDQLSNHSRSYIKKLIQDNQVERNQKICSVPKTKVNPLDEIIITFPEGKEMTILPEDIPLDILYEDNDIIVVNKPKDMVVHPAPGHYEHTLVNALLFHCKDNLSGINGVLRPGIVHRIDKDTTGALVVCKTDIAHQSLSKQLALHSITRRYEAIVHYNFLEENGTVDEPIGRHPVNRKKMAITEKGKRAVTHYKILSHLNHKYNHIECELETGRTHQIRVHMSSISHPILGDELYGVATKFNLQGQTLHAKTLGFIHPVLKRYMEFEAPLPEYFDKLLKNLEN